MSLKSRIVTLMLVCAAVATCVIPVGHATNPSPAPSSPADDCGCGKSESSLVSTSLNSPNAPLPTVLISQVTVGACTGSNGKCGITLKVKVTREDSDPLVDKVYVVVDKPCPACTTCGTPTSDMEAADVIIGDPANAAYKNLEFRFTSVNNPSSVRNVTCSDSHTVCVIVCLKNGTCVRKNLADIVPADVCAGLCPECDYVNGGGV